MRKKVSYYLYIIGVLLVISCRPGTPKQFIQPDDMENILYDYYMSQTMATLPGTDHDNEEFKRDMYFNTVLKKHGITRAEFDSSMVYYYTRADKLMPIIHNVQDRLRDDALNLGTSEGEVERYTQNLNGDTANVWEGNRREILVPYAPYNHILFEQKADTSYRKGDSFMFAFNSDFLYQGGSKDALVYLAVKYANDSIASQVSHFFVNGRSQVRIGQCDEKVKSVSGFFYLSEGHENSSDLKMLFISDIQLIRFHKVIKEDTPEKTGKDDLTPEIDSSSLRRDSMIPKHKLGTFDQRKINN